VWYGGSGVAAVALLDAVDAAARVCVNVAAVPAFQNKT
jgi:hypothetical protein